MRLTALTLLLVLASVASFILVRSHTSYAAQDRVQIAEGSSSQHWVGTDDLGRDRGVRVAAALLIGLAGAIAASALGAIISAAVGVTAAFASRSIASLLMYVTDLFLTLPWLFLLIMVRAALPLTLSPLRSATVTFFLLAILGWPAYAGVSYARASVVRDAEWLIHARATGLRNSQLALRHVLPHLLPLLLSQFLIYIPACLVAEANLGTMGLGISEPLPSWGSMLLSLSNTATLSGSHWVYLPIILLVAMLLLLEMLLFEA
jgi:peptide/nickel transport system permease protein